MPSLTFYGGVGEIGGNKILLEDGETRLFLDFGKNFEKERRFFDEPYLSPREEKHLLALGVLPHIPGIYKKDQGTHNLDAVILSHAHADHFDYIRYLKDDIPIYCGEVTKNVVIAREQSGRASSKEYEIAGLTKTEERVSKTFRELRIGERIKIGSVGVEAMPVDHSIPGALGLILHTSRGTVIYTGDFRRHGRRKEETEQFIERSSKVSPAVLIIEGTNMVNARPATEDEVEQKVEKVVLSTPK
ncbi:MAG: MBL fold metallo-hydrolase, partial [Dehalococcoidia bacterium]